MMWRDNHVQGPHGEAVKHIRHPVLGPIAFEFSTFAVDGRTDLSMVVYNPATAEDGARITALMDERAMASARAADGGLVQAKNRPTA